MYMLSEPRCSRHQEQSSQYFCMKYAENLCEECMYCKDPNGYCTFRKSCIINFIQKQKILD